jgi:hypothetical protein
MDFIPETSGNADVPRDLVSWETVPILPKYSQASAKAKRGSLIVDEKVNDQINVRHKCLGEFTYTHDS